MARPISSEKVIEIECQGMVYKTPKCPPISQIRGSHLPKHDQVWHRDLTFEKWDWTNQNNYTTEQSKWYDEEIERLHVGSWIMINGSPLYLNKYAHFFHQWWVLLSGFRPELKETSIEYFRFFELCEKDRFCFGDIGIKGRRVGLSSMSAAIKVLIGLIDNDTLSGIVSKTGVDAYEMYLMCRKGIENIPPFLMPEIASSSESEIWIAKQQPRISKNNKYLSADRGKNNRINYMDTSESAYDGRPMRHVTLDEAGKWTRHNVKVCLSAISNTLITGATVVGKVSVFSTVNKGDKGGDNFRELWDGSDHVNGKTDKYGRTKTKLKRFFIPAYRGYLGYVGKYGESIVENPTKAQTEWLKTHTYWNFVTKEWENCPDPYIGAKQWIQTTRDIKADDPEDLAEEVRMNPFTWQEVFRGANNRCSFRNYEELIQQIEDVEKEVGLLGQKENGRRMSFEKRNDGTKWPIDDKSGMWYILELLKPGDDNKNIYKFNIKCPNNGSFGCGGLDPIANVINPVDAGSDACLLIMKRYNSLSPNNSYYPVAMYLGRPPTKRAFFEQVYWALEYYGIKMLGERAPTDWITYAEQERLVSPEKTPDGNMHPPLYGYLITTERANGTKTYGITPSGKDYKEQHLTVMVEYAYNNMKQIRFLRLLRDMRDFDVNNRTDYDACMAFGYALIGLTEWMPVEKIEITPRQFMRLKRSKTYY